MSNPLGVWSDKVGAYVFGGGPVLTLAHCEPSSMRGLPFKDRTGGKNIELPQWWVTPRSFYAVDTLLSRAKANRNPNIEIDLDMNIWLMSWMTCIDTRDV